MASWLIPANTKFYDVSSAFALNETYWPMNAKISIGDTVYIYLTAPFRQIGYRCEVLGTEFDLDSVRAHVTLFIKGDVSQGSDAKPFMKLGSTFAVPISAEGALSLSRLQENGLNGMLMGARKLENNRELFEYIRRAFE